jgi:chromate reductase, NAD(P)H dehydrogenase (quinone)
MKIVSFSGALLTGWVSKQLVQEASCSLEPEYPLAPNYIDLKDYPFPVYDSDTEQSVGIPESIVRNGESSGFYP